MVDVLANGNRIAILDDYQNVALKIVDWYKISSAIPVDVFTDTLHDLDHLAQRLSPYTIVCAMRERTRFSDELLSRLPKLKLIATTGLVNRAIDMASTKARGIVVSGTSSSGNSTLEHIWALILATARHISLEDTNIKSLKRQWQTYIPMGLSGRTLGLIGVGRLGASVAKVIGINGFSSLA